MEVYTKIHIFSQESYKKPVDFTRACATRPAPRGLELTTDGSGKTVKQTHYQEQFIPPSIDKPQSFKKTQIYMQPSEPMMNATDYKDNYKGNVVNKDPSLFNPYCFDQISSFYNYHMVLVHICIGFM